jgi:hypothetical protein
MMGGSSGFISGPLADSPLSDGMTSYGCVHLVLFWRNQGKSALDNGQAAIESAEQ